jgi:hypothetical protein
MQLARSAVPLVVLAGMLWTATPAQSFDRGPHPQQQQKQAAPKPLPPPPPANTPDDHITKKETRMKQRDKEIDKRMKRH